MSSITVTQIIKGWFYSKEQRQVLAGRRGERYHLFAGYPHLHLWSNRRFAENFLSGNAVSLEDGYGDSHHRRRGLSIDLIWRSILAAASYSSDRTSNQRV